MYENLYFRKQRKIFFYLIKTMQKTKKNLALNKIRYTVFRL